MRRSLLLALLLIAPSPAWADCNHDLAACKATAPAGAPYGGNCKQQLAECQLYVAQQATIGQQGAHVADLTAQLTASQSNLALMTQDDQTAHASLDACGANLAAMTTDDQAARNQLASIQTQIGVCCPTGRGPTGSLTLSWLNSTSSEDGVQVWRIDNCAIAWSSPRAIPGFPTSYVDAGLVSGLRYGYRVRAWQGSQVSDFSNIACGTAP